MRFPYHILLNRVAIVAKSSKRTKYWKQPFLTMSHSDYFIFVWIRLIRLICFNTGDETQSEELRWSMNANLAQFDGKQVLLCLNIDILNYLLLN